MSILKATTRAEAQEVQVPRWYLQGHVTSDEARPAEGQNGAEP